MRKVMLGVACCSLAGSVVSAADFEAVKTGRLALIDVVHVDNTGAGGTYSETVSAGTFGFDYSDTDGARGSGQFAGPSFVTFCAELQGSLNGNWAYDILPVTAGPNPSTLSGEGPYDAADAAELNAVIAAAVRLGWINWDLSPTVSTTNGLRAAIQIGIWRVLFDNSDFTVYNANVASALATLESEAAAVPDAVVPGLRLMSNPETQDMLFVLDDQPPELVCDAEIVQDPTVCPCDWNRDGDVNFRDVVAFLCAYDQRDADFNGDGRTDCYDLMAFLSCYRDASKDCERDCSGHGDGPEGELIQISYSATDDGGGVVYDAYIETECEQIPVMNGEIIELRCIDGKDRRAPRCGSEIVDNRLVITAREARLVVIARDSAGNEVECGKVLCEPKDDKDCDDKKGGKHDDDCRDKKGGKHDDDCRDKKGGKHDDDCRDKKGGKHDDDCRDKKGGKHDDDCRDKKGGRDKDRDDRGRRGRGR